MTRYSASRGMLYSAPPTDEDEEATVESDAAEPAAADD